MMEIVKELRNRREHLLQLVKERWEIVNLFENIDIIKTEEDMHELSKLNGGDEKKLTLINNEIDREEKELREWRKEHKTEINEWYKSRGARWGKYEGRECWILTETWTEYSDLFSNEITCSREVPFDELKALGIR